MVPLEDNSPDVSNQHKERDLTFLEFGSLMFFLGVFAGMALIGFVT